jgi:hypothetical protein
MAQVTTCKPGDVECAELANACNAVLTALCLQACVVFTSITRQLLQQLTYECVLSSQAKAHMYSLRQSAWHLSW